MVSKIGFCIDGMSGPGSGAWTRLSLLVEGLVSAGIEVHVLGEAGVHEPASSWGTASVSLVPRLSKLTRLVGRSRRISTFVRATGCEVVHIEAPPFIGSAKAVCLASIHDLREIGGSNEGGMTASKFYYQYVLPRYAPKIDGWLSLSAYGSMEIEKKLGVSPDSVFLVPPIVTGPGQQSTGASRGSPKYVLALGHLEKRKNLAVLIKAAKDSKWPIGVELWIAGKDQGELGRLKALASTTKSPVRFLGTVEEDTKWRLLREASIVAVPSLLEGFGLVAIEAPLAGTPALVANRTALIEVAAHPDALVEAENPSQWADRIAMLLNDHRRRAEVLAAQLGLAASLRPEPLTSTLLGIYEHLQHNQNGLSGVNVQQEGAESK